MYKPINGYTKAKIIKTIQTRMQDHPAMGTENIGCSYLTPDGNRCAVGVFIPDNETAAQQFKGDVYNLLEGYSHLSKHMPLELEALNQLQAIHDTNASIDQSDRRPKLIAWVNENVS